MCHHVDERKIEAGGHLGTWTVAACRSAPERSPSPRGHWRAALRYVRIVIGEGLRLSLGGIGFRLLGTIALARLMRSLLFEVSPNDPITFTGVVALLVPWLSAPATFPRIVRHTAIRWSFSVVTEIKHTGQFFHG